MVFLDMFVYFNFYILQSMGCTGNAVEVSLKVDERKISFFDVDSDVYPYKLKHFNTL